MIIYGVDPGTTESALVSIDDQGKVLDKCILPNEFILDKINEIKFGEFVIEMVASYGMPVGKEVFETVLWIGRFIQQAGWLYGMPCTKIYRKDVKIQLCGSMKAKDANIRQSLIDIYGPGKEKAIGLKKSPGPLYGFKSHMWSALAVAVTYQRTLEARNVANA